MPLPLAAFPDRSKWKARPLKVSGQMVGDFMARFLSRTLNCDVAKNALPEDAYCVGVEIESFVPSTFVFRIASAVFEDEKPLPDVFLQRRK